ncbi:bile acid:sodium symporter family protein [Pseudonocardiaceae bacterium YIM PH 21723]|nr:bile acid:sodium symporter family protein [Pseudonocardiaceae bacterium YIM PH 21723]
MLGLGLHLTTTDFRRALTARKAVLVALLCQVVLMPLLCVALVEAAGAEPTVAVGMLVLAASPGGTLAALYSHLAGGEVALNITLTAINSVLSVITLPLVVWAATSHYLGTGDYIGLQPSAISTIIAMVLLPVALGMFVRHRWPGPAGRLDRPVRVLSLLVLVVVIAGSLWQNRDRLVDTIIVVGPLVTVFCVLNLSVGYWLPSVLRLSRGQAISTSMEIGVHNSALAITIAVSPLFLNDPAIGLAPGLYSLFGLIIAGAAAYFLSRRTQPVQASVT